MADVKNDETEANGRLKRDEYDPWTRGFYVELVKLQHCAMPASSA